MDAQPIRSERSSTSTSEAFLRGRVVGPGADGKGLIVEAAGELLSTQGDPSTPAGTPLVLARGNDGKWSPVATADSLPETLKQEILSMLAGTERLDAKSLEDLRNQLSGKTTGLSEALENWRQSNLKLSKRSENSLTSLQRPLLLQTDSLKNAPIQEGMLFLEITSGSGPEYGARLGGQSIQLKGPPGLAGNQGLWKLWPEGGNQWLTPASAPQDPGAIPLPPRTPLTPDGIRSILQRLVPEAMDASQPELRHEVEMLAKDLFDHLSTTKDSTGVTSGPSREIETRQLLLALDAWSQPAEIKGLSLTEVDRRLQKMPLDAQALQQLSQHMLDDPQAPAAVHTWIKQNLSKLSSHVAFPLGRGSDDAENELALSLAKDLSQFMTANPHKPELRELATSLSAMDLRAQQDPQGHVTLPWIRPQPDQWSEGALRVVDRRKPRKNTDQERHCVEITLQPPALGRVEARLELQDKHLTVKLQTNEVDTAVLIQKNLPELEERLKALQLIPSTSVQTQQPTSAAISPAPSQRLDLKA
jgi:Flagellar hook-length control protein FliK